MACLLLYPCASLQSRRGFYTSIRDHQASHVTTTHVVLSCPLLKVLQCMYWFSSQHEWRNNLVFYIFFFFSFFFFFRRCPVCHRKKSLRNGSFFGEFPRLPMGKILLFIYLWSVRELCTTAANMLGLTKNTVGNVYALLWHYCGRDLQDRPVIPFGGHVYVAKCDESQFKHKSKVRKLRICTIGHR